ncbi:aminotransferase class V-fold PLP-dependent enzyme [Anditalea andensis]|uniref:Phosphoserine aminotransferase n=1 Tax=Anditalea andensis TaxID=1048983 RepID=A0A074KZT3_9BACT|nr:aminotransferase class V-fold PLP-dependent enzyme [Anditalea andensis]KEO73715.1 phosphoserine aminotransferase [Anditalea andensis]
MISFSPGPSQVYPALPQYFQDAYNHHVLSANHRSKMFMNMYQEVIQLFQEKLHLPADYRLLFTSSATENWEIISQSLTKEGSYHLYSGAFGKKWFDYATNILPHTAGFKFSADEGFQVNDLDVPEALDIIAITQNETANASQVPLHVIEEIRSKFPHKLIAVDTTSSMGGIELDFHQADIWFASVQKCFGLPSGLGILILSPKALKKASEIGEHGRYNSVSFMVENADNYQTHYTPNVLGIYFLMRLLKDVEEIHFLDKRTRQRMQELENIVASKDKYRYLIKMPEFRSRTVLGISGEESLIGDIKKDAEQHGILLGSGYGGYKTTSFRVANFPVISDEQFKKLTDYLKEY